MAGETFRPLDMVPGIQVLYIIHTTTPSEMGIAHRSGCPFHRSSPIAAITAITRHLKYVSCVSLAADSHPQAAFIHPRPQCPPLPVIQPCRNNPLHPPSRPSHYRCPFVARTCAHLGKPPRTERTAVQRRQRRCRRGGVGVSGRRELACWAESGAKWNGSSSSSSGSSLSSSAE